MGDLNTAQGLVGLGSENAPYALRILFLKCVIYPPTFGYVMPSQRTVALSLDEGTLEIWKALPTGERSERVREALRTAEIVAHRDAHIEALQRLVKRLRKERDDLKLFGSPRSEVKE